MESLNQIYNDLKRPHLTIFYTGPISGDLIDAILETVYKKLEKKETDVTLRKKVYGVANEALQNLVNHIESFSSSENEVTYELQECNFVVMFDGNQYSVSTSNFITNKKVQLLNMWLSEINNAGKEGLNELYNQILKNKQFSHKGGAGLGMVDIAKKSDGTLIFNFEKVDDKYSIFNLTVNVE